MVFKIAHLLNIVSVFSLHVHVHGYTEISLFTDMTCAFVQLNYSLGPQRAQEFLISPEQTA